MYRFLVVVFCFLVGCGGGSEESSQSISQPKQNQEQQIDNKDSEKAASTIAIKESSFKSMLDIQSEYTDEERLLRFDLSSKGQLGSSTHYEKMTDLKKSKISKLSLIIFDHIRTASTVMAISETDIKTILNEVIVRQRSFYYMNCNSVPSYIGCDAINKRIEDGLQSSYLNILNSLVIRGLFKDNKLYEIKST